VRLSPHESCIEELHTLKAPNVLETKSEQLCALQFYLYEGRSLIAVAVAAVIEKETARNAFCDVDLALEAIEARVCGVWVRHNTTDTAPDSLY